MRLTRRLNGFSALSRLLVRLLVFPSVGVSERAVLEGAKVIVAEARRLAPVLSGQLRDSIDADLGTREGTSVQLTRGGVTASIGPRLPEGWYGHFPEFGTAEMPATPYLRPALASREAQAVERIADVIRIELREEVGR